MGVDFLEGLQGVLEHPPFGSEALVSALSGSFSPPWGSLHGAAEEGEGRGLLASCSGPVQECLGQNLLPDQ